MNKYITILLILFVEIVIGQDNKYSGILNKYNSEQYFNGVVLVATNGKIDYIGATGIADIENETPINIHTKFKIASITKTFTAVLVLQLYEQGKIDLKSPFGKYYPNYKGNAKNIVTIENLLTYSSGIPDSAGKLGMNTFKKSSTIDDYINNYCSADLINNPGTESVYSNTEYIILTKIIENVTQQSFEKVLEENILSPLVMKNSGVLNSKKLTRNLCNSYTINDTSNKKSIDESYYIENYFGAGNMYSTVEDLLKFDNGIFSNKLLNKSTTELMLKPNRNLNNVAFGVWYAEGYGTFNKPFIYRTGGILGSCSNWIHTIDDNKTIIVFNNTNGTNLYEMSEQLYSVKNKQKK